MAKKGEPGKDELLELLKRAADELKYAKEEARTAIAALRKEKAAHQETEAELEALKAGRTGPIPTSDSTQSTNTSLAGADPAVLEDLRSELSRLQARIDGFKRDLEAAQGDLASERLRAETAEASLKTVHGERDELLSRVAELEAQVAAAAAEAAGERERLAQEHQDALQAKAREREELERAHQEALTGRGKELEELSLAHATALELAAGKQKQAEAALAQEKDKHSHTAQKLLEARATVREQEAALTAERERVKGLEQTAQQLGEEGQRAVAAVKAQLDAVTAQLEQVTARWQDVERQYERLHKEMLLVLEQRDEARQQLEQARRR